MTIVDVVTLEDEANLVEQTDISIADNEVSADSAPMASGFEVAVGQSLANPVDGMLSSNVMVSFINNSVSGWYGTGVGFGLAAMQEMNDGKAQGLLNVDVVATDNTVNGFYEGIFVAVDTSAINLFGDVVSNVNVLVQGQRDRYLQWHRRSILRPARAFEHYFPPYEQVVDSNATMAIDVEIINNTVD